MSRERPPSTHCGPSDCRQEDYMENTQQRDRNALPILILGAAAAGIAAGLLLEALGV